MRKSASAPCLTKCVFPQEASSSAAVCNEGYLACENSGLRPRSRTSSLFLPIPPLRRGTSLPCISAWAFPPDMPSASPSLPTAYELVRYVPVTRVAACSMRGALGESKDDQDMAACLATVPDIHCEEQQHESDPSSFPRQRRRRARWMHKGGKDARHAW